MSIDTKEIRSRLDQPWDVQNEEIAEMCDEIDRLRGENKELLKHSLCKSSVIKELNESAAEDCRAMADLHSALNRANDELTKLREQLRKRPYDDGACNDEERIELELLREMTRQRSIKDEPPPDGWVLACEEDGIWYSAKRPFSTRTKHWMPQPPPPPAPDKFLKWFDRYKLGYGVPLPENPMRAAWDAAKKDKP